VAKGGRRKIRPFSRKPSDNRTVLFAPASVEWYVLQELDGGSALSRSLIGFVLGIGVGRWNVCGCVISAATSPDD